MQNALLMRARGVGKVYPPRNNPLKLMAGLLLSGRASKGFWALHDVSFSLSRGECLGIVGRNGAGKSTLLQLLCGTQRPSTGLVETRGRIAAMLELGAGFNPAFTGRENVYLSASVYGLSDSQIEERFAAIAAFADIGDFIERPVAEYSSGMYARLAFAVCAHVDADVLIIDEILGVGDAGFQAKCRRFLESFLRQGAAIFVSHDEHAVSSMCSRAIWLERGRQKAEGPVEEVLRLYRQAVEEMDEQAPRGDASPLSDPAGLSDTASITCAFTDSRHGVNRVEVSPFRADAGSHGHGGAMIEDVYLSDQQGRRLEEVQGGETVVLNIKGRALRDISRPIVGFILRNALGQNLFGDNTFLQYRNRPKHLGTGDPFHALFEFRLPYLPLGTYGIAPSIIEGTQQNHIHVFWMEDALVLTAHESPIRIGKIGVPMHVTATVRPAGAK